MVPNLSKGAGIKGTALYVLHDERTLEEKALGDVLTPEQQSAARVGFTSTRNLSTDDPELAWRLMCATAKAQDELKRAAGVHGGGRRTEKFCGHLSLSWEHGEQPDKAEMLRAADGALRAMGWDHLQALIVQHREKDHAHCHIVVNLIDPATGRAAPNAKNDYDQLQAWAYSYEKERGRIVCHDRAKAIEAREAGGDRQKSGRWLPRDEWEAQRAAAKAAGQTLWKEQQADKAAILQETRQAARAIGAEVREQHRPEWAALYRQQRAETKAMEKATGPVARDRTAGAVNFINANRDLLVKGVGEMVIAQHGGRPGGMSEGTLRNLVAQYWADIKSPAVLAKAVAAAHAADRQALKGREDAAHHAAQRSLWAGHKDRVSGIGRRPDAERQLQRAANENPRMPIHAPPQGPKAPPIRNRDSYYADASRGPTPSTVATAPKAYATPAHTPHPARYEALKPATPAPTPQLTRAAIPAAARAPAPTPQPAPAARAPAPQQTRAPTPAPAARAPAATPTAKAAQPTPAVRAPTTSLAAPRPPTAPTAPTAPHQAQRAARAPTPAPAAPKPTHASQPSRYEALKPTTPAPSLAGGQTAAQKGREDPRGGFTPAAPAMPAKLAELEKPPEPPTFEQQLKAEMDAMQRRMEAARTDRQRDRGDRER